MTEVVIIGCGGRTPLGFDRKSSAAAVRCGIDAIAEHPFMIDRFGEPMKVTRDANLDPGLAGPDRLAALAIPAAQEALAPLARLDMKPKIAVALNLGEKRPGHDETTGRKVAEQLHGTLNGLIETDRVMYWLGGHAGGILAMEAAQRQIKENRTDMVLVGGVDSYLVAETLEWLDEIEQLHSEGNIYGFCPGEAAGFVLLARAETAYRLDLTPFLELVSVGSGYERNLIKTEDICLGEGLGAAFRAAAAPLSDDEAIDHIICDMNGERYRGNEYGFAVLRNSGLFKDAAGFQSPADCWGDVGAASGPLYVGLLVEAELRGYATGPLSLIWASSEAGQRSAALLRRIGGT